MPYSRTAYRRPTTPKVRAAARRNIAKAHLARYRTREPRSIGRVRPARRGTAMRVRARR